MPQLLIGDELWTERHRYKQRDLPVTPLRPGKGGEELEGQSILDDVVSALPEVLSGLARRHLTLRLP